MLSFKILAQVYVTDETGLVVKPDDKFSHDKARIISFRS